EAAGLVIGGGTAYEGLIDRARLRTGESVLITAASGGVGSAAVQIAAAVGARVLAVAGARNHDYLRGLGARDVFDYHAADWVGQGKLRVAVEAVFPLDQAREALERVADGHTRGKIVLTVG